MPSKDLGIRRSDVKLVLEAAKEGLANAGIPGIELIASIPLLILSYYEVCSGSPSLAAGRDSRNVDRRA